MQKKNIVNIISASLIMSASCFANATQFDKPIQITVKLNSPTTANATQLKPILLMNLHLTPAQKHKLMQAVPASNDPVADKLPKKIQLGMNNTPVLDQGRHGTCVTFASSAAIDALMGKGDYVSPLCSLELGRYLEKNSYGPSGWDGSLSHIVMNQMINFGIVTTQTQIEESCSGVYQYPTNDEQNTGNPMTVEDYKKLSVNLNADEKNNIVAETILDVYERLEDASPIAYDGNKIVNEVKSVLADSAKHHNNRIIMLGTLLPYQHCSSGACATFNAHNDTWAMADEIKNDEHPEIGGHEMVISGYDDNAIAVDNAGKKHIGLFTLRNSWSSAAGDHGNYYMSYDYFKQYVIEVTDVARIESAN